MQRSLILWTLLPVFLGGASCRGESVASANAPEAETGAAGRAGGSGADDGQGMCEEHGVLEAVCTKCNPSLVPIFQAKGDWCGEHGFPESFCPICNPERGGKPTADMSPEEQDGAPADGTKIVFKTLDTARLAGIETARAEEDTHQQGMLVTARLVYDATRHALVNARFPGVVREIRAEVGTRIRRGGTLAVVESAELGGERSRVASARMRMEVAEAEVARERELLEKGVSSIRAVQAAERELEAARAELAGARAAVELVGQGGTGGTYALASPLEGIVTRRNTTVGRMVGTAEPLFEIVDTRRLWAELDVPEELLPQIAVGDEVSVTATGLGTQAFRGTIDYLAPEVDPHTRTCVARVPLDNPDGMLRANMFVEARVHLASGRAVLVPRDALQQAKGVPLVFVKLAEDTFETRRVRIVPGLGERIAILDGVAAGEEVATAGSFLLKTETLKGSIGAGCCEVEEK